MNAAPNPLHAAQIMEAICAASQDDPEGGHMDADRLLCSVLNALGYGDMVAIYENVRKWYA